MANDNLLKPYLSALANRQSFSELEAEQLFEIIMTGLASPAQIGGMLMGLRQKGETVNEITGAARTLRRHAMQFSPGFSTMDVCGTGGDGQNTLNISTAVALVVAGCGVKVAKHGNRAASSKSGTADVLERLGVNINCSLENSLQSLERNNICFLMAPHYHPAIGHVMTARRELGFRTLFNLLGPLVNPAGAQRQILGVYAVEWVRPMAEVLGKLGSERAWVVQGHDGLDELTTTGPSQIAEWHHGQVREWQITPEDAGLPRARSEDLRGGDVDFNTKALQNLLSGQKNAYRDIVLLNAAAALIIAGRAENLPQGVAIAAEIIDNGKAQACLTGLIQTTTGNIA
jgi:anthranilate phosphoribosyltransferase